MKRYTVAAYTAQLKTAEVRLAELNRRGEATVSRSDLVRAKTGDPQTALKLAKQRLRQRIDYYHFQIAKLKRPPAQLELFAEDEWRPPVDDGRHGREADAWRRGGEPPAHPPTDT